jgi:hypothetical protein
MHAVRVAARIERELHMDVEKIKGHYGEYKILIDDEIVIDGGVKALLGIFPSSKKVVGTIKTRLAEGAHGSQTNANFSIPGK